MRPLDLTIKDNFEMGHDTILDFHKPDLLEIGLVARDQQLDIAQPIRRCHCYWTKHANIAKHQRLERLRNCGHVARSSGALFVNTTSIADFMPCSGGI